LAVDFSIQRRKLISSDWFQQLFPEVRLSDDRNRLDIQDNTHGGAMVAWSVGSSVLGKVGDTLLLDDSVDPQMAASESECKSANSWVHSVFLNRLNNPATGTVIVTGQRLHQMDTFGLLLEAEPLPGDTSLSLSRQTQILFCRNQVGSATAPKRHSRAAAIQSAGDPESEGAALRVASQNQQHPSPS
jgi:hypothetical protein